MSDTSNEAIFLVAHDALEAARDAAQGFVAAQTALDQIGAQS